MIHWMEVYIYSSIIRSTPFKMLFPIRQVMMPRIRLFGVDMWTR